MGIGEVVEMGEAGGMDAEWEMDMGTREVEDEGVENEQTKVQNNKKPKSATTFGSALSSEDRVCIE